MVPAIWTETRIGGIYLVVVEESSAGVLLGSDIFLVQVHFYHVCYEDGEALLVQLPVVRDPRPIIYADSRTHACRM